MINRVVLVGRLTKDPILRKTQSGTSVVSFTVAVNRRMQNQEQQADFINCVAWNKVADLMAQYLKKGALVGIEGRIQTRNYEGANGRVYVTEVVAENVQFLESKNSTHASAGSSYDTMQPSYPSYQPDMAPVQDFSADFSSSDTLDIASDDLPF